MARLHLTQATVEKVVCSPPSRKADYFDIACKGLMLEVRQTGGKTFYLRYRDFRGKIRQLRLGDVRDISLAQARELAQRCRTQIAMGEDPTEVKQQARHAPTFAEFVEQHYFPYILTYKRSWMADKSLLKNHLLPRFGKRYMDEIVLEDAIKLQNDRRAAGAAPGSINRLLILMRYIFNLAIRWEASGVKVNPIKGITLMEENNKRERYLSVDEAQRLYVTVCRSRNVMLKYIVPMLILTGARKREVLDARWEDFDLERRIWRIPLPKSGQARHVPLSDGALQLLRELPRRDACPYAFANPHTLKPYASVFFAWDTARKRAGLDEVRIHDLRHSFASLLINSGRSLYEVQNILGHSQVKTTQRYAHLANETLLEAANAGTQAVGNVMRRMKTG